MVDIFTIYVIILTSAFSYKKALILDGASGSQVEAGKEEEIMSNQYLGMTANERLFVSGLTDQFEKAVSKKNISEVAAILKMIDLNDESINPILESLGLIKNRL